LLACAFLIAERVSLISAISLELGAVERLELVQRFGR